MSPCIILLRAILAEEGQVVEEVEFNLLPSIVYVSFTLDRICIFHPRSYMHLSPSTVYVDFILF